MKIKIFGDAALLVKVVERPDPGSAAYLRALASRIRTFPGVTDAHAGYTSILVEGPQLSRAALEDALVTGIGEDLETAAEEFELDVCFDGDDLSWAVKHAGLDEQDFIQLFTSRRYTVMTIGSPGFIYLSDVDERLFLPRKKSPTHQVQAGSIGIAGLQAGLYGRARPAGWRIIGKLARPPQAPRQGDTVSFRQC